MKPIVGCEVHDSRAAPVRLHKKTCLQNARTILCLDVDQHEFLDGCLACVLQVGSCTNRQKYQQVHKHDALY